MNGRKRFNLSAWGPREWAMTALALVVLGVVLLISTRGLAAGATGDVRGVRFGGRTGGNGFAGGHRKRPARIRHPGH